MVRIFPLVFILLWSSAFITTKPIIDNSDPFAALAFKVATDPFVGQITFCRLYCGNLSSGSTILNSSRNQKERIGRMLLMHSNTREEIKDAKAGDIVALVGMKNVTTGDTLCDTSKPVILEKMEFPDPVIEVAVEPKTKADYEKMGQALGRLAQEDPSFRVATDCLLYTSDAADD